MATINLGAIKFNWKGAYNSSTSYAVDDVVSSGGSSYVCIQAHSNQAVGNATAYWNIMSSAGTNGTDGTSVDVSKLTNDISTLAIRQATQENLVGYNTNSMSVDVFQDSSKITNLTNATNVDEYLATVYSAVQEFANDSNTVLLYHANNNLTDSSSNGITLTSSSTGFSSTEKKFGTHSFSLNGNSNNLLYTPDLDTVDNSVTTPTTGVYTLEMWFKYNGRSGTDRIFSLGNRGATGTSYGSGTTSFASGGFNDNYFNVYGDYGSDYNWDVSGTATGSYYDTSNWHHVALTRISNGTTLFHLDGIYKASNNQWNGDNIQAHYGDLILGQRSGSTSEAFNGYIDEVRYSNTDRYSTSNFTPNQQTVNNATGSFESTNITVPSTSKMGAIISYEDNAGTNSLNTDLVVQLSADGGSNYSTATLTALPNYSSTVKLAKVNDLSVTAGTQLKYKVNFANQSSGSKEARIRGVSLMY